MGLFDSILKGKNDEEAQDNADTTTPFKIGIQFSPLRLSAMKDNKVNMIIKITNVSNQNQLVSVDATLPKNKLVGFDATCIHRHIEKKVGEVKAGQTSELVLPIWANNQTQSDNLDLQIAVYAHYLDYKRVMGSIKRNVSLRVVQ